MELEKAPQKIGFSLERTKLKRGQSTTLSWNAQGADKVVLWKSSALALVPEPIDWWRIAKLGEKVKPVDKIKLSPEETTAYYLVARTPHGMRGAKAVLAVEKKEAKGKPITWSPLKPFLPKMTKSQFNWRKTRAYSNNPVRMAAQISKFVEQFILRSWDPPAIDINGHPEVIFEDESSTLSWTIADAVCAEMHLYTFLERLAEDTTNISGTRVASGEWGEGEPLACSLEMEGSSSITGEFLGPHVHENSIVARNLIGEMAVEWCRVDILSNPRTHSCSISRESDIKNAIKSVYIMLKNGCIVSDRSLDTTVDAFSRGLLSRESLWSHLLRELMNISVDTFICQDVTDDEMNGGHWTEYANDIILEWSPSWEPYIEYIILHELIHKCGLNSNLRADYPGLSDEEFIRTIEDQAHLISGACFD